MISLTSINVAMHISREISEPTFEHDAKRDNHCRAILPCSKMVTHTAMSIVSVHMIKYITLIPLAQMRHTIRVW